MSRPQRITAALACPTTQLQVGDGMRATASHQTHGAARPTLRALLHLVHHCPHVNEPCLLSADKVGPVHKLWADTSTNSMLSAPTQAADACMLEHACSASKGMPPVRHGQTHPRASALLPRPCVRPSPDVALSLSTCRCTWMVEVSKGCQAAASVAW